MFIELAGGHRRRDDLDAGRHVVGAQRAHRTRRAVPFAVAYATVTVCVLAGASVTVKLAVFVPLLPSVRLTLLTLSAGITTSSLTIVPLCGKS